MPAATFYQPIEKIIEGKCDYEYYNQSTNSYSKTNKSRICHITLKDLNTDIIMMIFTIRNQPSREKPYVWKIHSEGPKRMDQGATVPLRNTAVKLARQNKWKYIAIAVASEDVPAGDIISEYVISMESYQYGNDTVYDLSNDLEKIKNLGKPNFYRKEINLNGVKYSFSFIKKDKLMDYINIFDNRPYDISSKDNEVEEKYSDILDHTLYGIHIKNRNDALAEDNQHICIGWSVLGDLSSVSSKEELRELYETKCPGNTKNNIGINVGQIWRFINDAKIGDYVVFAEPEQIHIGRIESNYYYDSTERTGQDSDYVNNRKVVWIKRNINRSILSNSFHHSLGATMSFFTINDYRAAVVDLLNDNYVKDESFEDVIDNSLSIENEESLPEFDFSSSSISDGQNLIIYGTPGCGKSYYVQNILLKDYKKDNYIRTTFFQDYTNTDFVGQILPYAKKDEKGKDVVTYIFNPGPFTLALERAIRKPNERVALVIEELNRGSAASIFGDIFQLLDRNQGVSEYEINNVNVINYLRKQFKGEYTFNSIRLPGNLSIFATMNTSDQNVFTLDTAFKRRWKFKKLLNKFETDHKFKNKYIPGPLGKADYTWEEVVNAINEYILEVSNGLNSEDKQIGVYFIDEKGMRQEKTTLSTPEEIDAFAYKVFEYLWDDVAKFQRDVWFADNIKSLDQLVEEYKKSGLEVFDYEIFHKQK